MRDYLHWTLQRPDKFTINGYRLTTSLLYITANVLIITNFFLDLINSP